MTEVITSRDNPLVKRLRALAQDSAAYRKLGQIWLEGDHLCRALLARGRWPEMVVCAQSQTGVAEGWQLPPSVRRVVLADALMRQLSGLESPALVGFVLALPSVPVVQAGVPTVVLDRLQDPGNVGSILRSAAAFGFRQVLALKGTAALWSPKVLRAGMGAHFGLHLVEGCVDFVGIFKTLHKLNYRGSFLIEMWTEKAKEPVLEIIQARRWIEARMQEAGFIC